MPEAMVDLASIPAYKSTSKASVWCLPQRRSCPTRPLICQLRRDYLPQRFFSAHLRSAFHPHGLIIISMHPMPKLFDKRS
jgi:hypothetical protein